MQELLAEVIADLVALVVLSASAVLFAVLGMLSEQAGLASLATGQLAVGLWFVYMGALALFVGLYLLGYQEVAPRLRSLVASR